ncbi:hypothetical protein [Deinococcus multiflagellatus]|uniref:Uncharacterized protein n=1 Tax=Deinococcus multiflagellatus TaxID=1656887 RepID=A0ABW1ZRH6_9DEIO
MSSVEDAVAFLHKRQAQAQQASADLVRRAEQAEGQVSALTTRAEKAEQDLQVAQARLTTFETVFAPAEGTELPVNFARRGRWPGSG